MRHAVRVVLPIALVAAAGCGGASQHPAAPTPTHKAPQPVRTVIRTSHVVHPGAAVRLVAQQGVALRLRATGPAVSRNRLSSTHGYPPAHGLYVTFRITVTNIGRKPIGISPGDFNVVVRGEGRVSSYDGNAPFSGGARQLDPTEIEPGQRVQAPLTFDVSSRHGRLGYYPDRTPAVVWFY